MSRHWAPKTEGNLLDSYGITMGLMFLHCDCCRSDFFYIISRWVKFPSLDPKRVLKSRLTWGHKLAADFKETRSAPFNLQKLGFSCLPLLVTARSTTDLIVKELCPGCTSAFFATPKGLFQHQLRWLPIPAYTSSDATRICSTAAKDYLVSALATVEEQQAGYPQHPHKHAPLATGRHPCLSPGSPWQI